MFITIVLLIYYTVVCGVFSFGLINNLVNFTDTFGWYFSTCGYIILTAITVYVSIVILIEEVKRGRK